MFGQSFASILLGIPFLWYVKAQDCSVCQSFGTDFQDGGVYFQNIKSSANFTAHEEFQGCQDDYADNILVAPNGDQYLCSNTSLIPSDTPELITCPIKESQMYTGNWTIIVISNNGDCDPIDYMREFYVSVGTQSTVTSTPIFSKTTTTTVNRLTATTDIESTTITGPAVQTTLLNTGATIITVTPFPAISYTFVPAFTLDVTETISSVTHTTTTVCASPSQPTSLIPDIVNSDIIVTVLSDVLAPVATAVSLIDSLLGDLLDLDRLALRTVQPQPITQIPDRCAPRSHVKRDPESPTITVTASTRTSIVATATDTTVLSATVTEQVTQTVIPTITVQENTPITFSTAPQVTDTVTIYNILSVTYETTTITTTSTQISTSTKTC